MTRDVETKTAQNARRHSFLTAACCAAALACAPLAWAQPAAEPEFQGCSFGEAIADESGNRRLALLVGVGKYASPKVTPLEGPASDVRSMHQLLTGPNGYGFPKQNVCVLLDEKATRAKFEEAWEKALVARAEEDDIAVFFFAGHGSQARDWNGDEPDGYDETLMLHDARFEGQRDLLDDDLNGLVARLYERTKNVTMILDSCNSGSASRGGSRAIARFFDRDDGEPPAGTPAAGGDGGGGWEPESMPGLVVMSGARDGTSAMEVDGAGVFTQALMEVLSEAAEPLKYAQVSHRVPRRIAAQSQQVAYFQGALDRVVFGAEERKRPASWVVREIDGGDIRLQGVPMPGWSQGALLRVHAGAASMEEVKNPATARGYLELDEISGFEAWAFVVEGEEGGEAAEIEEGDLAVLVQAGQEAATVSVRLRPPDEEDGLSEADIESLQEGLKADEAASGVVEWSESGGFEVAKGASGRGYRVFGPEGRLRNTNRTVDGVLENLSNHADQKAFLGLRADPGSIFVNDETLQVRIVPTDKQGDCAEKGRWIEADLGEEQLIPMCYSWQIEVTLDESAPEPGLLVGGVVLWNDGAKTGFPGSNERELLPPGKAKRFSAAPGQSFFSAPPLSVPEHVLVFGTQEGNPIDWGAIQAQSTTRGPGSQKEEEKEKKEKESALAKLVGKFFKGKRGGGSAPPAGGALQPWTSTHVIIRAEANVFTRPDTSALSGTPAERAAAFAVPMPDMRAYAPADETAALYGVLKEAVALTDPEAAQPGVAKPILDSFAKAGLALPAPSPGLAQLADPDGPMGTEFTACEMTDLAAGDLVVQRDASAEGGHLAMVVDPEQRVVWGALGWDGSAEPVPGVGFQHQRFPRDWQRLGVDGMGEAACWRHNRFAQDASSARKLPGSRLDPGSVCRVQRRGGCRSRELLQ